MTHAPFDVPALFLRLAAEERRARRTTSHVRPAAREVTHDLYAGPPTHRDDVHPPTPTTA